MDRAGTVIASAFRFCVGCRGAPDGRPQRSRRRPGRCSREGLAAGATTSSTCNDLPRATVLSHSSIADFPGRTNWGGAGTRNGMDRTRRISPPVARLLRGARCLPPLPRCPNSANRASTVHWRRAMSCLRSTPGSRSHTAGRSLRSARPAGMWPFRKRHAAISPASGVRSNGRSAPYAVLRALSTLLVFAI